MKYLGVFESGVKNALINQVIRDGVFNKYAGRMPKGFLTSCVGGGRCVFRPKTKELEEIITNPENPRFNEVINCILADIGNQLNEMEGKLKLTPDFGRFAGVADILNQYTNHVLGICCEHGGCGGKASYTSTGINAAIDYFSNKETSIVLIGANGACGQRVFEYLLKNNYNLKGVCDLSYNEDNIRNIPVLKAVKGCFTEECLSSAEIIVATTVGNEFLNSNIDIIKPGTVVLLAHNNSIPINQNSVNILNRLKEKDILVVPGQLLTFGGALTSRIEWFWRENYDKKYFDKQLAHDAVYKMMLYIMDKYSEQNFVSHLVFDY